MTPRRFWGGKSLGIQKSLHRCKGWRVVSPTDQHDDSEPLHEDVVHAFRLPHGRWKLAWQDPVNKENSFVQNSVARGLPRCRVYRHDTNALGIARRDRKAGRSKVFARAHMRTSRSSTRIPSLGDPLRLNAVGKSSATVKGAGVSPGTLRK